ncbi:MAG: EamA family transporter [Bacteroidia bacterium]|nr:MAG: EamA family transporter [Bacteroidia bacterium]
MGKLKGFFWGLLSSSSFGMIPLFTLPLMAAGFTTACILLYRHVFAALILAIMLLIKGEDLKLNIKELCSVILCGVLYFFSAFLLFNGYKEMTTGLATTLHFLYPVFVALIMGLFFKQKVSPFTMIAIALALTGIFLLCRINSSSTVSLLGIIFVVLSGLAYAIYIVAINNIKVLREMNNLKLTFYTMSFCACILLGQGLYLSEIELLKEATHWINALLLALVPTLVSNIALIRAIKSIGSTLSSVLGAMEPLVAILIGIFVFKESFNLQIGIGISLILLAVILIILSPLLDDNIKKRIERLNK